jgi:hypothetical protein
MWPSLGSRRSQPPAESSWPCGLPPPPPPPPIGAPCTQCLRHSDPIHARNALTAAAAAVLGAARRRAAVGLDRAMVQPPRLLLGQAVLPAYPAVPPCTRRIISIVSMHSGITFVVGSLYDRLSQSLGDARLAKRFTESAGHRVIGIAPAQTHPRSCWVAGSTCCSGDPPSSRESHALHHRAQRRPSTHRCRQLRTPTVSL